ncbi:MAG: alkaline phosphatase family protein [Clostridia bacterium]|nr:alkaline phosphatase family protein [Clostridia bacterium]
MLTKIISLITALITVMSALGASLSAKLEFDGINLYRQNVAAIEAYENDLDTAIPQTAVYNLITDHYNSGGKKEKKVLLLGYDGGRADALMLGKENGAVKYLLSKGAEAYIGYCGAVNYPKINRQATSTAPGWCSILTGQWGNVTGVTDNAVPKSNDHLTLLTTLVEDGIADSTEFYTSWDGHFMDEDSTYIYEKQYCEDNKLPVGFNYCDDDNETYKKALKEIKSKNCADFIFPIFEATDHAGHDTGFSLYNEDYTNGFEEQDILAKKLLNAVRKRANYKNEDWLIIITSDHGGFNTGHGFITLQERMTFIVTNKAFTEKQIADGVGEGSILDIIR